MGRRLTEATNACRALRTRGDTVLRRLRWLPLFEFVLGTVFAEVLDEGLVAVFVALLGEVLPLSGLVGAGAELADVSEEGDAADDGAF